jgi:hypothetical protein
LRRLRHLTCHCRSTSFRGPTHGGETPPLPGLVAVVVTVLVLVVGSVVLDSVLVSVLVLLVVDSVLVLGGTVLEMLELDVLLLPSPPLPAITTTATIKPTMIASSAATR